MFSFLRKASLTRSLKLSVYYSIMMSLNFSPVLSSFSNRRSYFGRRILALVLSAWVCLQASTGAFEEICYKMFMCIFSFSMVGIYSRNCPEWVIAEQVCLANIERAFMAVDVSMFFRAGSVLLFHGERPPLRLSRT